MTVLLNLPNEVILLIASHLCSPGDLNSLLRGNRRLAALLAPVLNRELDGYFAASCDFALGEAGGMVMSLGGFGF
ncbi:uncharacterized protein H6S33_005704 [Morchella sextelata]|uniref:uncharacterized protein n=1 Tax=Morchella sextelata TaxID=1174677 RepID=UPI001D050F90|nr:uncharacterized protein H6S33_005704 [Morchella sextelata]KAH0613818.1 hypothetical protein H6S33_005704 [Morchella sextelata]